MATQAAKRFSVKTDTSVFKRLGRINKENITKTLHENITKNNQSINRVCKYWLEGRCTRNPCKFQHPDQATNKSKYAWKNPNPNTFSKSESSPPIEKPQRRKLPNNKENIGQHQIAPKTKQKSTSEVNIDQTENTPKKNGKNLLPGFYGDGLSMVTRLEGHTKDITGIALPAGSNKLFSASKDKSLRVWDCNSGQCGVVVDFDHECGTLVNEGQWILVGLQNMIKAWNLNTQHEVIIRGSGGQVNTIIMFEDVLFAGMEDGTILSWKSTSETSFSEVPTALKGHNGSVLSLVIGAKSLYSGSSDNTIRVWDCETLECKDILNGHMGDVTAVLCWDQYLLSGSLDKKIKIWGENENGKIEEVYEHIVDNGVVSFCGMHDAERKPILLCSCKENGVILYDLPSFVERGRVVTEGDIQAIQIGPDGLFFTGDSQGLIAVWKLNGELVCKSC